MSTAMYVGLDVAKAHIDGAVRPSGDVHRVPHDDAGLTTLVTEVRALAPTLVVLEATGGYETDVASVLALAGIPVAIVNPRQVRDFAKALGRLAKTDAIDARVLALFAERVRPAARPLPDAAQQALVAMVARRRQLIDMLTAERNRLPLAHGAVRRDLREHIPSSQAQEAILDQRTRPLAPVLRRDPRRGAQRREAGSAPSEGVLGAE